MAKATRAGDKRKIGTAKNPKKVAAPSAAAYKMVPPIPVVKGKAGRPKKAK